MKRDTLKELGLSDDVIDKVMAENGRDIEAAKAQAAAERQTAQTALEASRAEVDALKSEVAKAQADAKAQAAAFETRMKVNDFLRGKAFANDITRDVIAGQMIEQLGEGEASSDMETLLAKVTEGKEGVFKEEGAPTPPVVTQMSGGEAGEGGGVTAAFRKLNPQLKI